MQSENETTLIPPERDTEPPPPPAVIVPILCLHGNDARTCNEVCACGQSCALHNNLTATPASGRCNAVNASGQRCACLGFLFPHNFAQVTQNGDGRICFHLPADHKVVTKGEAAVLAAWLLALCIDHDDYCNNVLIAIREGEV